MSSYIDIVRAPMLMASVAACAIMVEKIIAGDFACSIRPRAHRAGESEAEIFPFMSVEAAMPILPVQSVPPQISINGSKASPPC